MNSNNVSKWTNLPAKLESFPLLEENFFSQWKIHWTRYFTCTLPLILCEHIAIITVTGEWPRCILTSVVTNTVVLLTLIYVCNIQVATKDQLKWNIRSHYPCTVVHPVPDCTLVCKNSCNYQVYWCRDVNSYLH